VCLANMAEPNPTKVKLLDQRSRRVQKSKLRSETSARSHAEGTYRQTDRPRKSGGK
jgi:hypothetical protein